ncbi:hypothetical protein HOY80DRAFT_218221 [Tuber brumale]|nr:hypothetical protein HOY80DRAFT_218221 [Tuber brumale]
MHDRPNAILRHTTSLYCRLAKACGYTLSGTCTRTSTCMIWLILLCWLVVGGASGLPVSVVYRYCAVLYAVCLSLMISCFMQVVGKPFIMKREGRIKCQLCWEFWSNGRRFLVSVFVFLFFCFCFMKMVL